jgi:hypothetical protein
MKFNKNKFTFLLVLVNMILLAGCIFNPSERSMESIASVPSILPSLPSESSETAAPITAPASVAAPSTEVAAPAADASKAPTEPDLPEYTLEIKGNSNQLSPKALKNMSLWRENIVAFAQKHRDSIYLNGPNSNKVALTFDDGPDNINTPAIIDSLKKYNVKGSFFFVGSLVKRYPEVVRYAFDNGNLVLNHSCFCQYLFEPERS